MIMDFSPVRVQSLGAIDPLFVERSTPCPRAYADHASEDPGEVTLICKAAVQGHIEQRQSVVAQLLLGSVDAARQEPIMRRGSYGAAKRTREMTHRQTTLPSHLLERYTTIEVGRENLLGAPYLPRREPTPNRR